MMAHKQRSKSTSSIPAELDVEPAQCPLPRLTTGEVVCRKKDLAKWKSHRRSVRCDMVGEREERERAELAAGGSARKPDTPSEMQGGEREAGTPASHKAASFQTPQATGFKLQPRSISLPPQSYAANSPYALAERAVTPAAIPYSTQARISQEASLSSSRSNIAHADQTGTALKGRTSAAADVPIGGAAVADRTGGCLAGPTSTTVAGVTSTALTGRTGTPFPDRAGRFPADPRSGGGAAEGSGVGSTYKAPDPGRPIGRPARGKSPGPSQSLHSMDTKPAAAQVTASLPRSSRRSGSSRLASVVSPRPFGTQSTKISPVSRAWTMDDSYRRFNGETNLSKNSEIADQQHLFLTPEDKAQSQRGSVLRSNEAERGSAPFLSPLVSPQTSCDSSHSKMASAVLSASETRYEDIRIRLTQRTDNTQDFGFQTSWQSTGIFIKSIQQGSPAELCQLRVGDAIVAVDGRRVSEMSCEQWKASLDSALQQGSLVLDVRRNGESGSREKFMNARTEVISQPRLEAAMKSSHTCNSHAITDVDSKDMNGGFCPESMGSKELEPLSLKNLKRRSEFFEPQGGSESAISDIRVPSISTSSAHHSWDPQEERKRQEVWQQEQERLLQEKYKRDQQKLDEEWRRAQQDAQQKHLEVDTRNLSPFSPASPLSQATLLPFEECSRLEDCDELEEMLPQGAEPYKEEVARKGQGEELGLQRNCKEVGQQPKPEEEKERKLCQQVTDTCPREQEGNQKQDHWKGDGFAKIHPEISLSDRENPKSTFELDEVDNPEVRVVAAASSSSTSKPTAPPSQEAQKKKGRKKSRPLSQVEMDRLQILEEMKKRTQLLTDSSWIRQRSTTIYKEPIHLGGGMRRYESLDNLNTARSWRQSPWPPSPAPSSTSGSDRPQSAASSSASSSHSYTRSISSTLPCSSSMGSLRQNPWSQPSPTSPTPPTALNEESSSEPRPSSQHPSSLYRGIPASFSAKVSSFIRDAALYKLSSFVPGSGVIKSSCIDCKSDLRGTESGAGAGAEVRLRNRQLYCHSCYARFSDGLPISM